MRVRLLGRADSRSVSSLQYLWRKLGAMNQNQEQTRRHTRHTAAITTVCVLIALALALLLMITGNG